MQEGKQRAARLRSGIGLVTIMTVATLMTLAGSDGTRVMGGVSVFAIAAIMTFAMQWVAFVPAYLAQSERYYDLVGSLTYLTVVVVGAMGSNSPSAFLLAGMVGVWALRLGTFLFLRIRADGSDRRFDRIKPFFLPFLMTWSLQGLWVLVTAGAALAAMVSTQQAALGFSAGVGALLWITGFTFEVVADQQKRAFRRDPGNHGQFIRTGLWSRSRHPNYFGEIMLWCGVALVAWPALSGWQHATLISPLFVYLLLTRVSGVPLLEAQALQRWGDDPAYVEYLASTPVLLPRVWGERGRTQQR